MTREAKKVSSKVLQSLSIVFESMLAFTVPQAQNECLIRRVSNYTTMDCNKYNEAQLLAPFSVPVNSGPLLSFLCLV